MRALRALLVAPLAAAASLAAPVWSAQPEPGGVSFQPAATPVMEEITRFHDVLLIVITVITAFVLLLLLWVMIRYNSKANPTPAKFSHNTLVEILWTAVPVVILVGIAIPSFRLLYNQDVIPDGERVYYDGEPLPAPGLTIKATGWQWHWEYEYPDNGEFVFISDLMPRDQAEEDLYLLQATEPMVAPEDTTVRMLVTGADVIHNWAMPAFGIKMDAIPGRLNETWFYVDEPGTYYGQCSELCGIDHAFMPIEVEIVPQNVFDRWAAAKASGDSDGAARIVAAYKSEREAGVRLAQAD